MQTLYVSAESAEAANPLIANAQPHGAEVVSVSELQGFSGSEWLIVLALPIVKAALPELSKVIVAWLSSNSARKVRVHGIELAGYSAKEVEKILLTASRTLAGVDADTENLSEKDTNATTGSSE
jgi:hypothetical protein